MSCVDCWADRGPNQIKNLSQSCSIVVTHSLLLFKVPCTARSLSVVQTSLPMGRLGALKSLGAWFAGYLPSVKLDHSDWP